jgi:putative ABC transport system permease protein
MNHARPMPSSVFVWLLRTVLGRDRCEAVVGDLIEAYRHRREAGDAPRYPRLWCDGMAIEYLLRSLAEEGPRWRRNLGFVVRDSGRALRSEPSTTALALLVLTLSIGAATVTFSVVDAVVLRQLPFEHPDDLVAVAGSDGKGSRAFAPQEVLAWQGQLNGFDSWAALRRGSEALGVAPDRELVPSVATTASLFDVLRVHPLVGRFFTAADEEQGREPVVVIGYGLWQRRFGGDVAAIGRRIDLGASHATILGIMPAGLEFPVGADRPVEIWEPYVMRAAERVLPKGGLSSYLQVFGRLRPGVARGVVQSQIVAATQPLIAAYPFNYKQAWPPSVVPAYDWLVGPSRLWMVLALSTVGAVLLVGCVNVANLLLARSARRARELAVRAALGASRRQLVAVMLVESLILSTAAGVLALLGSVWGIAAARAALPTSLPRLWTVGLNERVFAAAVIAAVATGLLFGAVPAWEASRTDLIPLLKDSGATVAGLRRRWQSAFLIVEVAVSAPLLVVVTLLVSSFVQVMRADLGFERHGVVMAGISPQRGASSGDVARALRAVPGVSAAAAFSGSGAPLVMASGLGFSGSSSTTVIARETVAGTPPTRAEFRQVMPEYFAVAGMRFLAGQPFGDSPAGPPPIVLDDLAARRVFGTRAAVGATVILWDGSQRVVSGVVAHVEVAGPEQPGGAQVYLPLPTGEVSGQFLLRLTAPLDSMASPIRTALAPFQPSGAVAPQVFALDDAFWRVTKERRFIAGLMALFGTVALFTGAAGVYGVMASVVAQQTREFAVRVALGATRGQVGRGIMRRSGAHLALGLALGLPAAWWESRGLASLLFGVRPTDAYIYLLVAGIILGAGFLASWSPARRAAQTDPIVALKAN